MKIKMIDSFKNKTVLITGASSGIGEEFARELASKGANLILVARNTKKLESLADELKAKYSNESFVFSADLSSLEAPREIFKAVKDKNFSVDILINNAGFAKHGSFENSSFEENRNMIMVNAQAVISLTRLFLPEMISRKSGGILNVASTASFQPIPYLALYAATKSFVKSFSEGLWSECKNKGVRVFCLCPGNTKTEFHQFAGIEKKKVFFNASPKKLVKFAIHKFLKKSGPSAIYGLRNKIIACSERFSPGRLVILITKLIYRPQR